MLIVIHRAGASGPADSGSMLATGSIYSEAVNNLMAMGFEREQVVKAMRAAFNNPDRAAEYLITVSAHFVLPLFSKPTRFQGIPEHLLRETAPAAAAPRPAAAAPATAGAAAAGAPATTAPAAAAGGFVNLFEAAAAAAQQGQPRAGAAAPTQAAEAAAPIQALDQLRDSAQFQQLRQLVQANPNLLQPILQQLGQTNPQLLELIQNNSEQFLQMLAEGDDEGDEAMGGGGAQYVTVTPQEMEVIQRVG